MTAFGIGRDREAEFSGQAAADRASLSGERRRGGTTLTPVEVLATGYPVRGPSTPDTSTHSSRRIPYV